MVQNRAKPGTAKPGTVLYFREPSPSFPSFPSFLVSLVSPSFTSGDLLDFKCCHPRASGDLIPAFAGMTRNQNLNLVYPRHLKNNIAAIRAGYRINGIRILHKEKPGPKI